MFLLTSVLTVLLVLPAYFSEELPTLYQYYAPSQIKSGLVADQGHFTLNGKNITIYSGSIHYFRVPKQYWRDGLRKLRAAGLNTVETYIPWNLHEPSNGTFEFGDGGTDLQDFVNLEEFLTVVQEEDLFAIVRPGPFIGGDFEFGGLPSWLLRDQSIKYRSNDITFMKYVTRYFNELLPRLVKHQFTGYGGPIIAIQIESNYGNTQTDNFTPDKQYLEQLYRLVTYNAINQLVISSDQISSGTVGTLPERFLMTVNIGDNSPKDDFDALQQIQPNKPVMALEYHSGSADSLGENHKTKSVEQFKEDLEAILQYPGSFNIYMFHGGTNFGFLNGATDSNGYQPITTSYDYDAPISENGNYTEKYFVIKSLIEQYSEVKTKLPEVPEFIPSSAYAPITTQLQFPKNELYNQDTLVVVTEQPMSMEQFDYLPGYSGQNYGYFTYRQSRVHLQPGSVLEITGHIHDTIIVLVNGKIVSPPLNTTSSLDGFGSWKQENSTIILTETEIQQADIDLILENFGRVGSDNVDELPKQYKGIDSILIDGVVVTGWSSTPLPFYKEYSNELSGWEEISYTTGPGLYKSTFVVDGEPHDTFVDMSNWTKGIVIVNGIVLGRYSAIGPQQSLYLPAPFLKSGINTILVFEHYQASNEIRFSDQHIYLTR